MYLPGGLKNNLLAVEYWHNTLHFWNSRGSEIVMAKTHCMSELLAQLLAPTTPTSLRLRRSAK